MNIRTLKTSEYRGCPIYVRNLGNIFEYLVIIKKEIFSANLLVTKNLFQQILGEDYTPKQLADTVSFTLKMAETTIDTVLDSNKK